MIEGCVRVWASGWRWDIPYYCFALCATLVVDNSSSIVCIVLVLQDKSQSVAPQFNTVLQNICGSYNSGAVSIAGIGTKKYTKRVHLINSTRTMAQATNGVNAASAVAADPKLESMRAIMKNLENGKGVDAFIVPSEDPHMVCVCYDKNPIFLRSAPVYHSISF
jgi:hypothetical protein